MTWKVDRTIVGHDRDDQPVYGHVISPVDASRSRNSLDLREAAWYITMLELAMEETVHNWKDYSTSISNEEAVQAFLKMQKSIDNLAEILSTDALLRVRAHLKENDNAR